MNRVPLQLYLLAHPRSSSAALLAQELMRRFVEPPSSGGLRLPVRFTPDTGDGLPPAWEGDDGINLGAAEHTLVVVLADARMARRVTFQGVRGTGAEWQAFLAEGARFAPVGGSPHHVFGVAIAKPRHEGDPVDASCFSLGGPRHMLGVAKEPSNDNYATELESWLKVTADEIALHITIRAIHLLDVGTVPAGISPEQKMPVEFFLSHAKADLSSTEADPIRQVEAALKELPIDYWFDAADIAPGQEFSDAITRGLQGSSIILSFLTDSYASRPWCKREILDAKRLGVPIFLVDALSSGESRNFPYLGNVPTVHWTGKDPKVETQEIVSRAVREALRFKYNLALLRRWATSGETILASPPEAVTLAWKPSDSPATYLYPDPPLTKPELEVLTSLRPGTRFVTPFAKITEVPRSERIKAIAVSTSVSNEKERLGLSKSHEEAIFDEIHAYFLLAGLQIAYGGALQLAPGRGTNFTLRLFELVRAYSQLASNLPARSLKPILNVAAWPMRLSLRDEDMNIFNERADYIEGLRPSTTEVPEPDAELFPSGTNIHALEDIPNRRFAWTRGLTAMRFQITRATQAKIVVGGTLSGFKGIYPGVVEEAWISLVEGQPLYLVGAFGGAARAVIDLLQGRPRPDLTTEGLASSVPHFDEVLTLATQRGLARLEPTTAGATDLAGQIAMPDRIVHDFQILSSNPDPTAALNNGLTQAENEELFRSLDPSRIAELVLTGLSKLP